jgi:hypothetical protein
VSVTGIASNMLFQAFAAASSKKTQGGFGQVQAQFQELGQDLQAGNLTQAQQDFAAIAKTFSGNPAAAQPQITTTNTPTSATPTTTTTGATPSATTGATTTSPSQAFSTLSQALQSGNLSAAQAAFVTLQQELTQGGGKQAHFHHHGQGGGDSQSGQSSPIAQAFSSLLQAVQGGNLSAAQSAYATMQQDLSMGPLAGFGAMSSTGSGSTSDSVLNVTV